MSLDRKDFRVFFRELHSGNEPFAWQERLLDGVLERGRWPARIVAPTGAGKTSVIDVHVFAQALMAAGAAPRLPRRLAMVVDRRVLVDDQFEYAQQLAGRLADTAGAVPDVLAEISALLWTLRLPDSERRTASRSAGVSPLVIGRLRGGSPPSRSWRDHPTAATVLCSTPDMWGSRLLFRGYGSAALAWPREAGLLAVDSVVVVDEAHLARQLLYTARRVEELVHVAKERVPWLALQVVETTATPQPTSAAPASAHDGATVGVEEEDLDDTVLSPRLTRPKPVTLCPTKDWESTKPGSEAVTALADAVIDLLPDTLPTDGPVHTVGCFVNTVARAVAVTAELSRRQFVGRALRVVMICGQVRPIDLDRVRAAHPGLFDLSGNREVDVLVSTQSLEVGVDLDLAAIVTELASGPALVQRAGRVNRRGLRERSPIVVMVPGGQELEGNDCRALAERVVGDEARSGPYDAEDLRRALVWLHGLAGEPAGLAPWQLRAHEPPGGTTHRVLYQRPELAEVWHWARTSDDLAAEPELDLWLAEDFTADTSVGLVVRDAMPVDAIDAVRLVGALPPQRHEVFSVPYRSAIAALRAWRAGIAPRGAEVPPLVLMRGEDSGLLEWGPATDGRPGEQPRLRPGDIVVVDSSVELFTPSFGDRVFSPPVLVPVDDDAHLPTRARADDVLEAKADLPGEVWERYRIGSVVHRIELPQVGLPSDFQDAVDALTSTGEPLPDADMHAVLQEWLERRSHRPGTPGMVAAAARLLSEPTADSEVVVHRGGDDQPLRLLVIDRRRATADEGIRQVWTPSGKEVTLEAHQTAVRLRSIVLGRNLGLGEEFVEALALASEHHDDGKQDARFQLRLGARGDTVLAKSRAGTTAEQVRRNERRSGLPGRWRHEQRSVTECWTAVQASGCEDPQLVARLVGTSHGHGRSGFPHAAGELLLPGESAALQELATRLFDRGEWDDLIEATQQRYGVWGCAYLESILRAADGQVSEEGS